MWDKLISVFTGSKQGLIKDLADGIGQFITTDKEKQEAIQKITEITNSHLEKMQELALEETKVFLADKQSARSMQVEALKQEDRFAKRYVYYLATLVVVVAFGFNYCMFFIKYPVENRDMINAASGVINTGALIMVLSFFFGSSKSSEDKTKMMSEIIKKNK